MRRSLVYLMCATLWGLSLAALAADVPLTPAQVAFIRAETRKADDQFVQTVARIASVSEALIRDAMPSEGRITDPAARVVAVVEKARNQALSEQQKAQIVAAEQERRRTISSARESAAGR